MESMLSNWLLGLELYCHYLLSTTRRDLLCWFIIGLY